MSMWNYVATAQKATSVTHSCVGSFTSPHDINLIIAKCSRIEIHLFTSEGLQPVQDVPIYGRIATLELFRPHGELQDSLFLSTEKYKFCILQWDTQAGEIITRAMGDVSNRIGRPTECGQMCSIDPECRLIALHLYVAALNIMSLDSKGELEESFIIRLEELQVLDIKFLYGCPDPTIAVLYEDNIGRRHLRTYVVDPRNKDLKLGPWLKVNLDSSASMLIPVPMPLGGVLVIGEETICYCSASVYKQFPARPNSMTITNAYGRVDPDGSRYLLGDLSGFLHLLVIIREGRRASSLKLELLGETSVASTISYLDSGHVYIGSSYGDSQIIKLHQHPDVSGSHVEVLERFVNIGPITDFCVVDEGQAHGQIVTCSGAFKDGSLRIVRSGIGINDHASVELPGIKGIWSLRSSTLDIFDTFLVVSFVTETRILEMNLEYELEETYIEGFISNAHSLFCQYAIHDQLVQVTDSFVRLVGALSRKLLTEWRVPPGFSITVATANATQVLLATRTGNLVYLEIGEGSLKEVKHMAIEFDVSCLNINPIGDDPLRAEWAVVGLWKDYSIRVYSLPHLKLITGLKVEENLPPRSTLLCRLEGICYLLCGLGDGHLFNFIFDMSSGELSDKKKIQLGTKAISLHTFCSKNSTHVFAASDRPTVIYSNKRKLRYTNVNQNEVNHMCSFSSEAFPSGLAIANEDMLTIGSIDDIQKLHIRAISHGEHPRRICQQEQSRTFALCSVKYSADSDMHFVRLLDDQTFHIISSYPLDVYENGCSILSCLFTDDNNVYYCVGTAYVLPEESESSKGRILVFLVEDGKLKLVTERETKGAVYNLNAFNGKLLAGVNQKIQLYKWMPIDDSSQGLQCECEYLGRTVALYVQTRGDFIVVGDLIKSISLLLYMPEERAIEERARDFNPNWMTSVAILDDDIYLGAEHNFNLFTVRRKSDAASEIEGSKLEVVGEYHLGDIVNRFRRGSLVMCVPDSKSNKIPTVIFATVNGAIGVVASLPEEQYQFLEKLQMNLVKVIKGVGGLNHEEWRSFRNEMRNTDAKRFLDGDLIDSFLDLRRNRMEEIAAAMGVTVEELCDKVEELNKIH